MRGGPTIDELLAAVSHWLEGGAFGADGFHGKVAANALAIARRELQHWPAAERRAIARLEVLTGQTGPFEALETQLCTMLRDGTIGVSDDRVQEHLRATALDRLAIDQPAYRHCASQSST